MKKLNVEIAIDAIPEAVWHSIIDLEKYKFWTSAFSEGSYFEGGWNKGDSIQFLAEKDGKLHGMISEIAENIYPKYLSIKHLGMIHDGVIDTTSEEVKKWAPSFENYTLEKLDGGKTLFKMDMLMDDSYYDMFVEMWGKALKKLKEVTEKNKSKTKITIEAIVNAPIGKVWACWNEPAHITQWAFASDDWHCPAAKNDLKIGGKFSSTMASKDGKMSFDFWGTYSEVVENKSIAYIMGDGRTTQITFTDLGGSTKVVETFDAENTHPVEMQQGGWQAILDNFKKYAEE